MLICIDYDGTYTEDPELWNLLIRVAKERGHKVICATMRFEQGEGDEVKRYLENKVDRIYFTGRKAKLEFLRDNYNVNPDVWIDDNPLWLYQGG